jgi:transcriptional regulator with XRE-family HTH domain
MNRRFTLGKKIKLGRVAAGYTQKELAKFCHTFQKTLSAYERDLSIPSIPALCRISKILGLNLEYLLEDFLKDET